MTPKKFRQGSGSMAMNAIDYYIEGSKIIEHTWGMGGSSKKVVDKIPSKIEGYTLIEGNNNGAKASSIHN